MTTSKISFLQYLELATKVQETERSQHLKPHYRAFLKGHPEVDKDVEIPDEVLSDVVTFTAYESVLTVEELKRLARHMARVGSPDLGLRRCQEILARAMGYTTHILAVRHAFNSVITNIRQTTCVEV